MPVLLSISCLTLTACTSPGTQVVTRLSAPDYLSKVTNIIQLQALQSTKVDWEKVHAKAIEMTAGAKSTEDTYGAINYILSELGDNHSFLISRTGAPTIPHHQTAPPLVGKRVNVKNTLEEDGKKFGFIYVGGFGSKSDSPASTKFARAIQKHISETSNHRLSGWIVDLRGNTGGNMWPMLVGVGPLIGTGTLGYFQYPKTSIPWFYENGEAGVINAKGKTANFKMDGSIKDCADLPVAVLIDGTTASSGEAVTISFKGRAKTCLLGQHTRGLSTANESIKLPDGAMLYLTTSGEADRNKVSYDSGISPDIAVEQRRIPFGDKNDPGIKAAMKWLLHPEQK
jgi:carboxyl-terminal processing protease